MSIIKRLFKKNGKQAPKKTSEGDQSPQQDSGKTVSNSKEEVSSFIEKTGIEFGKALVFLFIAAGVAYLVRWIAGLFLDDTNLSFVWLEIIKLVITLALLIAIASLSETRKMGVAVAVFTMIFFISALVNYDYPKKVEEQVVVEKADYQTRPDDNRLSPGTHEFKLAAGEETDWHAFPIGDSYGKYFSETYDFTLIFSDGSSYYIKDLAEDNESLPDKDYVWWKIKAHSPQRVIVKVLY